MIKYFALCGAPEAGKSEVQKTLERLYGIKALDDSRGLRDAAMILYGLSEEDVTTQSGKRRLVAIGSETLPVRVILGRLGDYLEANDPLHIPRMARRFAETQYGDRQVSFGSIRKNQAQVFQDDESLVIEVVRPGVKAKNSFDLYDRSLVDVTIINDYDPDDPDASARRLEQEIRSKICSYVLEKNWEET